MNEKKQPAFPEPPHVGGQWWDPSDPDVGTADAESSDFFGQRQRVLLQLRISDDDRVQARCRVSDAATGAEMQFAAELLAHHLNRWSPDYLWITNDATGNPTAVVAVRGALADWAAKKEGRAARLSIESDPLIQHLKEHFSKRR